MTSTIRIIIAKLSEESASALSCADRRIGENAIDRARHDLRKFDFMCFQISSFNLSPNSLTMLSVFSPRYEKR